MLYYIRVPASVLLSRLVKHSYVQHTNNRLTQSAVLGHFFTNPIHYYPGEPVPER